MVLAGADSEAAAWRSALCGVTGGTAGYTRVLLLCALGNRLWHRRAAGSALCGRAARGGVGQWIGTSQAVTPAHVLRVCLP